MRSVRKVVSCIALAAGACAPTPWIDRYDAGDVSHRTTAELCRSGGPSAQEFDRCMSELLPPSSGE
jgi:hypothetical protein